ncbi:MAG: hypothetical protein HYX21_00305 [Candidatus Yanofskybacteria bacterium]|nr:hypothetical protein [Candidatus Yanofskybacteria bacterium]
MFFKKPKNDDKYVWTNHVVGKMLYYRISESLVKRVVRFPKRVENGIALGTIACMQPAGSKNRPSEVWTMYQSIGEKKKKIISAWRYPGVSKVGEPIPIPEEILNELTEL